MIHNEILDKEKNIFFTFSYGEMSCMADASRTIENNKKYQNIRYIAKDANRSFLTVYVFIINFNVNDNKGNEKKKFHYNIHSSVPVPLKKILCAWVF